jgi:ParD-like antitoxin of type II bacterial toxin-antitoxin system
MSKSIRITDELSAQAAAAAAVAHRSPPQQIEHWAHIGRVLESTLSYSGVMAIKRVSRADLDAALNLAGKEESIPWVHKVIGHTAATVEVES